MDSDVISDAQLAQLFDLTYKVVVIESSNSLQSLIDVVDISDYEAVEDLLNLK